MSDRVQADDRRSRLGFVGLGTMGTPIVKRLMEAGHQVLGHNRTAARGQAMVALGMAWADSPRAVAAQVDITFTMVSDATALRAVCESPEGLLEGLGPGSLLVDLSTVGPAAIRQLAPLVAARGAELVDAPISGSPRAVGAGSASFMMGASDAAAARVAPILLELGGAVTHVGEVGQGALMKLAANIQVAVPFMALAEGLALAEKGGVPRSVALAVLTQSATMSAALAFRAPFTLEMPHPAPFSARMMEKDLGLILDEARRLSVPLPTAALTSQMLSSAAALGWQEEDFSILFSVLAKMAGLAI
ncbi:MAG: NAD(P)-dependent oxidoreductase [Candidatus Dormibacteraceae bacterium]